MGEHAPACSGRLVVVDQQAVAGALIGQRAFAVAVAPALEGILPVGEGQAGIGAGKGRVELQSPVEEMPRLLVLGLGEAVHVPKAAMIGLPGVERVGRLQHGAVALDGFDLGIGIADDAVADIVEHGKEVVGPALERVGPDDPGGAHLDQFDADDQAAGRAAHRAGGDIVDAKFSAGLLRRDGLFGQREHRPTRDDEEIAELGKTGDDVVGETVGQPAARTAFVDKRHDGQGSVTRFDGAGIA